MTQMNTPNSNQDGQEPASIKRVQAEVVSEETVLSAKELKRQKIKKADEEYRANEIKFGIRKKLIILFAVLILGIAIGITYIANRNQTESLWGEKNKQGQIIIQSLMNSIKGRLIEIYAENSDEMAQLKSNEDFKNFYEKIDIAQLLIEDIDNQKSQPDLVYAYFLGKGSILLGHTDPTATVYQAFQFPADIKSYFEQLKLEKIEKPTVFIKKTLFQPKAQKNKDGQQVEVKPMEVFHYSYPVVFTNAKTLTKADIDKAVGEVHVGLSIETINKQIADSTFQLQLIGLIAIVSGILAAIIFATLLANPMTKMINGMKEVSKGNFQASVLLKSKDEVGLMSKTFNVMLKGMSILVSPEVAQVVLSGGDLLKSGQKRNVTVLFSDIRGFTTLSEALTPHEVVMMLNAYLEIMTDIIVKYGGVVDKFVGDEIFAVFGAPFDHPMHEVCAVATGLEMGWQLEEHNNKRISEGQLPIGIGIGVNTGDVIAGAMGSTKRIDFTSIGDAVNLGARLEGTNKVYGTLMIISEFTYEKVAGLFVVRELDLIKVKGKNKPVQIFEVVAFTDEGKAKVDAYLMAKNNKSTV